MRFSLLSICILVLVSCKKESEEVNQALTPDWESYQLKGDVEQLVVQYQYEVREIENLPFRVMKERNETLTFDSKGQLISSITYNDDGSIFEKRLFQGKNKLLEYHQFLNGALFFKTNHTWENDDNTIIVKRDAQGAIQDKTIQVFRNGLFVEKRNYGYGGTLLNHKIEYVYDEQGLKVEEKKYDRNENLKNSTKFIYDKEGNLSVEITSDKLKTYTLETHYSYDNSGRLTATRNFSSSMEKPDYEEIKEYDEEGLLNYTKSIDHIQGEQFLEMYAYDEQKRVIETKTYINEQLKSSVENRYNDEGFLAETKSIVNDHTHYTQREYTYDEQGNWISQKVSMNGVFVYQINRTITYFK
jgi:YD repeat-containing protein